MHICRQESRLPAKSADGKRAPILRHSLPTNLPSEHGQSSHYFLCLRSEQPAAETSSSCPPYLPCMILEPLLCQLRVPQYRSGEQKRIDTIQHTSVTRQQPARILDAGASFDRRL